MKYPVFTLLSAFILASCNAPTAGDGGAGANPLFTIASNPEHPAYIALRLLDRTDGDTAISYAAKGLHNGDTVGFTVTLAKDIPAGVSADGTASNTTGFRTGTITFIKSGPESDRFVAALAELWQVEGASRMKEAPIQPLVFSSNRGPVDHDKSSTYSFKLFFDQDAPVPGEVFFTFDTYKKTIEFQEKDSLYRQQIVRSFAD